jgi:hypothetical protein
VGLFSANGQSYIAQLSYLSDGFLDAAFTYMHNDQSANFVGGNGPGGVNTYAGLVNLDFGNFFIAGYGAYQTLRAVMTLTGLLVLASTTSSWKGAQLGVYGGQLPQTLFGSTGTANW